MHSLSSQSHSEVTHRIQSFHQIFPKWSHQGRLEERLRSAFQIMKMHVADIVLMQI